MDTKKVIDFLHKRFFLIIALVIFCLIVALVIFKAGMLIGERKCGFSVRWNDNYHQNFAPRRPDMRQGLMMDNDLLQASGANGQIIKIDGNTLVVKSPINIEKAVLVTDKTIIMRFKDTIMIKDLLVDEEVVVIGEPNEAGQIEAKFIRVLPKRPSISGKGFSPRNF